MTNQGQKYEYEERPQSVSSNEPDLERLRTKGGHIDNRDQPSLPVVHRSFANPAPLGLLSFATGIFLLSMLGVHARGIVEKNILVGVFVFFGGVCQFISGIMEFVAGNTVGSYTQATRDFNASNVSLVWSYSLPIIRGFELELRIEYACLYPFSCNSRC